MSTSATFLGLSASFSNLSEFFWPNGSSLVQALPTLQSSAHLPHRVDVLHTQELSSIHFYFSSEVEDFDEKLRLYFSTHRNKIFLDSTQEAGDIEAYWGKEKGQVVSCEDPEKKGPNVKVLQNAIQDLQRPTFRFEIEGDVYEHPSYCSDETAGKENSEKITFENKRYVYQFAKTLTEKYGERIAKFIFFSACQGHWKAYAAFVFSLKETAFLKKETHKETFTVKIQFKKDRDDITDITFYFIGTLRFNDGQNAVEARFSSHFDINVETQKVPNYTTDEAILTTRLA
ncbi:MAG: hypothetical protein K940chlam8_01216 [Chlamydiae bacterium]|nr:hypothetical protein [Chlamydiota bacterium]